LRRLVLAGLLAPGGVLFAAEARSDEEAQKDSPEETEAQNVSDMRPGLTAVLKAEPRFLNGSSQDRDSIYAVRPSLSGQAVRPWIRYLAEAELAQNPPYLLYAWVDIRPWKELGLEVGQQDTPVSRHENYGLAKILFPEADTVADYFWGGRDKGLTVHGTALSDRLDYAAGAYGGSPLRQYSTIAGNYVFDGRLTVSPLGEIRDAEFGYVLEETRAPFRPSFSLQGYYGKIQSATENFDQDTFNAKVVASGMTTTQGLVGVDAGVQSAHLMFFAEGYARRTTPPMGPRYTSVGAWGQVGVLLFPNRLDVAVRASWANASLDLSNDMLFMGEAQVAWYVRAPTLIVKLRYGYSDQQTPGTTALGAVTLPATAGHLQIITLQLNLAL
jgi:hypothetical protein